MSMRAVSRWRALAACATGRKHRQSGEPGDDAVFSAGGHGLAVIVVCDGAGSARLAREGAEAMASGMGRFLLRRGRSILRGARQDDAVRVPMILMDEIERILGRMKRRHRCARRDLASTMLFALGGKRGVLIGQVGDGAIVLLGEAGAPKVAQTATRGEFAGETVFVTSRTPDAVPVVAWHPDVDAIVAMSDGGEASLIMRSSRTAAPAVTTLARWVATQPRPEAQGALRIAVSETLVEQSWDDVAVAVLARRGAQCRTMERGGAA